MGVMEADKSARKAEALLQEGRVIQAWIRDITGPKQARLQRILA